MNTGTNAPVVQAIILFVVNSGSLTIRNTSIMNTANSVSTVACYMSMMLSFTAYVVSRILTRQHEAMIGKEDVGIVVSLCLSFNQLTINEQNIRHNTYTPRVNFTSGLSPQRSLSAYLWDALSGGNTIFHRSEYSVYQY